LAEDDLIYFPQAQTHQGAPVFGGSPDPTLTQDNLNFLLFHDPYLISATDLPRFWAIISGLYKFFRASKAALMTL
jgi:hypothetical protein